MAAKTPDDDGAISLSFARSVKLPTLRAAYSDRAAALMSAFCQNAYIPFEVPKKRRKRGEDLALRPDGESLLRAELAAGGFALATLINTNDVQAFLAIREDFAVLAFRGTASFNDWRTDLNVGLMRIPDAKRLEIHSGFWRAYESARVEIEAAVNTSVPPTLPLYITGHSLGGALAQIASAALERDNLAACYTFGSPRVATMDFDREVKCPHYRVINDWDLVPGVPPTIFGYRHTGDPRLLTPKTIGQEALRRDQTDAARVCAYILSTTVAFFIRRLTIIDDHMIWNYRRQLDTIAAARNGGSSESSPWTTPKKE
jgi:hypothetical protein